MLFWRGRHEVREEDLSAYVDGELNTSVLQRVEAHLEVCAVCRESVAELRAVRQSVKELPRVPVPRSFVLREADVAAEPATAGGGLFGSVTPLLSGVAAIAIVAFVVLVGVDITSNSDGSRSAGTTSGDVSRSSTESEQLESVSPADSAVPPAVGERDGEGTDLDDETQRGALNYASDEESVADDGQDDQRGFLTGRRETLADDGETGLRIAEAVAAGIAVVAGGAALVIWWRRRTVIA